MLEANTPVDTVVVGAGHAGLAMSRCLAREGISHVVLERDTVGSSWRTRWDSFHLNTPGQANVLPDGEVVGEPGGFLARDEWIAAMEAYQAKHGLPIRTGVEVRAVRQTASGYEVETSEGMLQARNVVLCSGDQNVPRVPALAQALPDDIEQLHSQRYRSAAKLPAGAVLVVGSAQSGGQIAEDLLEAGRTVWLCTSRVGRGPRNYRGRDLTGWMRAIGMTEQRPGDVPDVERFARQPMVSGTRGGHSMSLHLLGRTGAKLLGRLCGVDGHTLTIGDDLQANVAHGDAIADKLTTEVDKFIDGSGIDAPQSTEDPADTPCAEIEQMAALRSVDLREAGIRSVIWATGFGGDFSYLPGELLDERGLPRHTDGVCAPGLYCVGLLWLRRRASGLIPGAADDAQFIVEQIRSRAGD